MLIKHSQNKIKIFLKFFLLVIILVNVINAQDCKSKVKIVANKADALIYVDNVLLGNGKVTTEIEKGNHFVLVKEKILKWNQQEVRDTLRIIDCTKNYLFNYDLEKLTMDPSQPQNFEFSIPPRNESFINSSTFKILLGSAAVLGGVAAYFKIKADKKYDEYLLSKSQSTLDEVNRLDLYSGISFGLLQINFGYLIYKFLTD